jgi:hypothetical protein
MGFPMPLMPTTPFKLQTSRSCTTRNSCDVPSTTKTTTLSMTSTSSLQLTLHQQVRVNNFLAFSRRLRTVRYPKDFKPAIEKYNGRSDLSIWLKMDNIAACASGGNEDHMAGYFPIVMGKAPLLWLDNLPAECITS